MNLIKKCIAEFIGAFAIVFGGCGAILATQISNGAVTHVGIAATFGLVVMTMVFATGHISGAHFNPAVTIAFSITRHFPNKEIIPYIIAQCLGAAFASLLHVVTLTPVFNQLLPNVRLNLGVTLPVDNSFMTAFVWEAILTFFLMFVIFGTAVDQRAPQVGGLFIGLTVTLDILIGGPLTGAAMNPARHLGPALLGGGLDNLWLYWEGPVIGSILAALCYNKFLEQ